MKRKTANNSFSLCVQPAFIVGTDNEDGSSNFAPITWVSAASETGGDYMLVVSMFGSKMTKRNVLRTGRLSVNLVSVDMLALMDYFGTRSAANGPKDTLRCGVSRGERVDVPTLDDSPWVYECEVIKTVDTGLTTTFFCAVRNVQIAEDCDFADAFDVDLTKLDPVIYSGKYHSIGKLLGRIGDFIK